MGELEQAAFQKKMFENDRKARLLDVETYVQDEVWLRVRNRKWPKPTGIEDNNWKHWTEFCQEITHLFHGVAKDGLLVNVGWQRLCKLCKSSLAFPSSARGSIVKGLNLDEVLSRSPIEPSAFASCSSASSAPRISDPTAEELKLSAQRIAEHASMVTHLRTIKWLGEVPASHESDVYAIKRLFDDQYYPKRLHSTCDIVVDGEFPTSLVAWLAVCEQCMETIRRRRLWPKWFRRPHDRNIRPFANAAPDTLYDPGNIVLEIVWFALRFYRHVDDSFLETMLAPGLKPYGERSQRSSKGITNFRGNVIEGLMAHTADIVTYFV